MKKLLLILVYVLCFGIITLVHPTQVRADACTDSCTKYTYCSYTSNYCCGGVDGYGNCLQWCQTTTTKLCCVIDTGQGRCVCCADGGCYFDCTLVNTPTNGPTAPPGSTNTPTHTPTNTSTPTATSSVAPTPTPVGTVRVRSLQVPNSVSTCGELATLANDTVNTTYIEDDVTLYGPGVSTQRTPTDGTFTRWLNKPASPTTYGIGSAPVNTQYVPKIACHRTTTTGWINGWQGQLTDGETLTWNIGYTAGAAWSRVRGGDVYAANSIRSYIPVGAATRIFVANGSGGRPGIVTYGNSYDFDSASGLARGEAYVSTQKWLVNETFSDINFYDVMYHRFHNPAATFTGPITLTSQLNGTYTAPDDAKVYYYDGDVTIDNTAWNIPSGQKVVVFVSGNLTINKAINVTPGGFLAFIVQGKAGGGITISTNVGTTSVSTQSSLDGVYMTNQTFDTGPSTLAASRRLVGQGMFIANDFTLGRDLDADSANDTTSAELFIYDPALFINMPLEMQELPITWSEVAP